MTLQSKLFRAGAWLFFAGLVTGSWAAAVLTDIVAISIPRLALAAHLNGLLGGLWCVAVAATLPHIRYGETGRRRLSGAVATATWANWIITLVASGLGVRGLSYGGSPANDIVAALLQVFVVIPSLIAAAAWAHGLRPTR